MTFLALLASWIQYNITLLRNVVLLYYSLTIDLVAFCTIHITLMITLATFGTKSSESIQIVFFCGTNESSS